MRILITGGTGFLGSTLASRARLDGHEVLTLDVSETSDIRCEMNDANAVHAAVTQAKPEVTVHLAALLIDDSMDNPQKAVAVNVQGTTALFSAAGACSTAWVIYASSVAAVGLCPANSGDDVTLRPVTVYDLTKAFGEHLARDLASQRFPDLNAHRNPSTPPPSAWGLANDRIYNVLGYAPHTTMPIGLDALIENRARSTKP